MPDNNDYFSVQHLPRHTEWPPVHYHWLLPSFAAVWWIKKALKTINRRIEVMNPISDLYEMAYAKKSHDALQKALKEIQFIESIKP